MTNMLTVSDLRVIAGEARVLDLRIAERLEMADPHDIRRTIESNRAELERYGEISGRRPENIGRGRPATEFWLNESQTLLLCMFSKTEKAADIRQEVIGVYMTYRQGLQPSGTAARGMPEVNMAFEDYACMMRALIAGNAALAQVNDLRRSDFGRNNKADMIGILIDETSLSDEEIAEKVQHIVGDYIPEQVAYYRRKRRQLN
jgi:hypothetical protein